MMEFTVVLVMFGPVIAGVAILLGCILGEISHKKKMKKQDEQLDFLHERMGDNKYFEFLKLLKDCYNPQHAIDYACKQYGMVE